MTPVFLVDPFLRIGIGELLAFHTAVSENGSNAGFVNEECCIPSD
jgi:hypothetical protein